MQFKAAAQFKASVQFKGCAAYLSLLLRLTHTAV